MFWKFIHVPVFLASLAIGIFFVYLHAPENRTVYVYPMPENVDQVAYRDALGNCFYYQSKERECPQDRSKLATVPPQT